MTLPATRSLLLAASLLLTGLSGCSKKDDVAPAPTVALDTGIYTLDGVVTTTTSYFVTTEGYDANRNAINNLSVHLDVGNSGATNSTALTIYFTKPLGSDPSSYKLQSINLITNKQGTTTQQRYYSTSLSCNLTPTSTGYAGTFNAKDDASTANPTSSSITDGSFNARVR